MKLKINEEIAVSEGIVVRLIFYNHNPPDRPPGGKQ